MHDLAMKSNRLPALLLLATLTLSAQNDRAFAYAGPADPGLAVAWNKLAYDIESAEDQFLTFKGVRAHAMMHIAIHDALNAAVPVYRPFAHHGVEPFADPIAAAAQAAHDVLLSQYPGHQATLDAELAKWLAQVSEGTLKTRGIALGGKCAASILAARAGDRWDFPGTYTFSTGPGAYQTTPPWDGFIV